MFKRQPTLNRQLLPDEAERLASVVVHASTPRTPRTPRMTEVRCHALVAVRVPRVPGDTGSPIACRRGRPGLGDEPSSTVTPKRAREL